MMTSSTVNLGVERGCETLLPRPHRHISPTPPHYISKMTQKSTQDPTRKSTRKSTLWCSDLGVVEPACQHVCGDEHFRHSRAKLFDDAVAHLVQHGAGDGRARVASRTQLAGQGGGGKGGGGGGEGDGEGEGGEGEREGEREGEGFKTIFKNPEDRLFNS